MKFLILSLFSLVTFACNPAFAARVTGQAYLAQTAAMSVSVTSSTADIKNFENVAIQFIVSGGSTATSGTFSLEGSNDNVVGPSNVTNWKQLDSAVGGASVAYSGVSGSYLYNLVNLGFRWIRAKYTRVADEGSLTIILNGKGS